jgi:AAA15 family ATPase/GTPase
MRITKVKIENFRSIKFAEFQLSEFNIFVGQNNHGKTNLFEALEWFYNGTGDPTQITFRHEAEVEVVVELEFDGIQAGIETINNEKNRESFRKFADGRDTLKVRRCKAEPTKRALWDEAKSEWSV